ncbi:MAG: polysaccharide biosynthesis protein [Treponemataceae bacterium]|nr:polysaccharide biosynthesis protein [Treponemataceae bacterium]
MPFVVKIGLEKKTRKQKFFILFVCDILTFVCMGVFTQFLIAGNIRSIDIYIFAAYICAQLLALVLMKYYRIRISDGSVDLIFRACVAIVIVFVLATIILGCLYGFVDQRVRWSVVYSLFALMGTMGIRYMYRMLGFYRFRSNYPRTYVYGAGNVGATMVRMSHKGAFNYCIIGYIDDNPQLRHRLIQGVEVKGSIDDFEEIARTESFDKLIIAISVISAEKIQKAVETAKKYDIDVKIIPGLFEQKKANDISVRDIDYADLLGRSLITSKTEPVQELFSGKTIMVTGAGGSIGSEICQQLMEFGPKRLVLLDIDETELHDLGLRLLNYQAEWSDQIVPVVCDIKNAAKIERIFNEFKPDIVLHAAAYKHVPLMEIYPEEAILNNICGSYNVFNSARKNGVQKVIVISTDKAVNPTNIMGATKRVVEMIASALNSRETEFCCVRFGNVIGSRGSMLPTFLEEIKGGYPITVTDKRIIRYFMAIKEAVGLVFRAATIAKGGEVMVLDMGEPVKIYDFAQKLISTFGDGRSEIVITGLRPGEKLYEELLANKDNTLPTENQKIFRAKVVNNPEYTEEYLSNTISKLFEMTPEKMVEFVQKSVPEYHKPDSDKENYR